MHTVIYADNNGRMAGIVLLSGVSGLCGLVSLALICDECLTWLGDCIAGFNVFDAIAKTL